MYNSKKKCAKMNAHSNEANWRKNLSTGKNRVNGEKPNRHLARQMRRKQQAA